MNLDRALALAVRAHAGQKDQAGQPYILHPLRVMMKTDTAAGRIVAVLHDVVEDTALTLADLRAAGLAARAVDAVDALTRRPGEPYLEYMARAGANPLARRIKIADLEDNMGWRRLKGLAADDRARMARYRRAYRLLTGTEFCGARPPNARALNTPRTRRRRRASR